MCGLTYPRVTVLAGVVYIFGRVLYGIGYRSGGPSGRMIGVPFFMSALLCLIIGSVMSCLSLAGGVSGLAHFAGSYIK